MECKYVVELVRYGEVQGAGISAVTGTSADRAPVESLSYYPNSRSRTAQQILRAELLNKLYHRVAPVRAEDYARVPVVAGYEDATWKIIGAEECLGFQGVR
ncbi:hypothetical protein Q9L58_005439 [Maublancomyces gigas]|uniref:Uncharacterized protein n=1 Tax=Discina gigas TaxID=1032678 RepID=A0ABR3GIF3_9PEZI